MDDRITEEAVQWLDALKRDDADWDGFTRWLEKGEQHRSAYDAVALLDERIDAHRETLAGLMPAEAAPSRISRRLLVWGGGAGAAAAAAMIALMLPVAPADADQIFRTARGEARSVALRDGSRVELASATSLTVGKGGDRLVLDGTASFAVPHRPGRSLTIQAGGLTITDIGTRFEVTTGDGAARVQVSEGEVLVTAPELASAVRVNGGKKLVVDRQTGVAELRPAREFASWTRGRLVYDNAPLPLVAAEVGRYSGQRVVLARDLAGRRFSGVLTIGDGSQLVGDLARLMDMDARGNGTAVRLVARTR